MLNAIPDPMFESWISPLARLVVSLRKGVPLHIDICAVEEMSELTKEIAKHIRYGDAYQTNAMAEEIGHVMLMVVALMYEKGLDETKVLDAMRDAVNRMLAASGHPAGESFAFGFYQGLCADQSEEGKHADSL